MNTLDVDAIRERIRPVVAEVAELEPEEIRPDDDFLQTLGINSMSLLEVIVEMEKSFGVVIKPERLPELTTLQRTAEVIHELLDRRDG